MTGVSMSTSRKFLDLALDYLLEYIPLQSALRTSERRLRITQ